MHGTHLVQIHAEIFLRLQGLDLARLMSDDNGFGECATCDNEKWIQLWQNEEIGKLVEMNFSVSR